MGSLINLTPHFFLKGIFMKHFFGMKLIIAALTIITSINLNAEDKKYLNFLNKCGEYDSSTKRLKLSDYPEGTSDDEKKNGLKIVNGNSAVNGCVQTSMDHIYEGNSEAKKIKVFANYNSKSKGRGKTITQKYSVDKFLIESGEENQKFLYCDTKVDGKIFNRVQCRIVSNAYCKKIIDLKQKIKECSDLENSVLAKIDDLGTEKDLNKTWYNSYASGLINKISQDFIGTTNIDFVRNSSGENEHDVKDIKGDLESVNTSKFFKKNKKLDNKLLQKLEDESALCMEVDGIKDEVQNNDALEYNKVERKRSDAKKQ
jgi:hypothetical protein